MNKNAQIIIDKVVNDFTKLYGGGYIPAISMKAYCERHGIDFVGLKDYLLQKKKIVSLNDIYFIGSKQEYKKYLMEVRNAKI